MWMPVSRPFSYGAQNHPNISQHFITGETFVS
jgi:hypothetical protein